MDVLNGVGSWAAVAPVIGAIEPIGAVTGRLLQELVPGNGAGWILSVITGLPDVEPAGPSNADEITSSVGQWKWVAMMILVAVGAWRVVMLGLSWGTGNSTETRKGAVGLMGVLLAIYLLFNFNDAYNFFTDVIPAF